jgi:hypothetical protein
MGNTDKDKEFVESLVKEQGTTKAFQKLHRGPLLVSVYRHTSVIESLEKELIFIEDAMTKAAELEKVKLEERKSTIAEELKKLEADTIEGVLTTLTYRDINDIKASVTEAVLHFKEYNFDIDVVMSRIAAEERYMTIFCALKQAGNTSVRYFKSLEEIAAIDDFTIFDLYNKWEKQFVLTDEELKN